MAEPFGLSTAAIGQQVGLPVSEQRLPIRHLPDAASLYRAFDWVAIPSTEEGLGLILQEAVMVGVPVLTSELAVFREQLGDAGWYAPADNAAFWGELLTRAFASSGEEVVEAQLRALAPEQAWNEFSETTRRLFSCT